MLLVKVVKKYFKKYSAFIGSAIVTVIWKSVCNLLTIAER